MLNIATSERNGAHGCASSTTTVVSSGAEIPSTCPLASRLSAVSVKVQICAGIVRRADPGVEDVR